MEGFHFQMYYLSEKNDIFETIVYRKPSNVIHLHWNEFAPKTWKRGTYKLDR